MFPFTGMTSSERRWTGAENQAASQKLMREQDRGEERSFSKPCDVRTN